MKKKVFLYSDCYFFAGCENIIVNILSNKKILNDFDVTLGYRYSEPYEKGLNLRVDTTGLKIKKIFLLAELDTVQTHLESVISNTYLLAFLSTFLKGIYYCLYKCKIFFLIDLIVLTSVLSKIKPNIIHVNNGGYPGAESCLALILASYFIKPEKIYLHVNNIPAPYTNGILKPLEIAIDKLVFRRVTKVITASREAGKKLTEIRGVDASKRKQVFNTILPRKAIRTKNEYLSHRNLPDKLMFAVIAIFEKRKGHIYMVNAVKKIINERVLNEKFIVVFEGVEGLGKTLKNIQNIIENENLEPYVKIIGREENIMDLMNAADVLVLPSIEHEDFPIVILEAMYLGKPVIGTKIGGITEEIEHGRTGLLVEPKDVDAIARAMEYYITTPSKIVEHGNDAKSKFEKQFDYELIMNEIYNLYSSPLEMPLTE